jgi:hypothetical protein
MNNIFVETLNIPVINANILCNGIEEVCVIKKTARTVLPEYSILIRH